MNYFKYLSVAAILMATVSCEDTWAPAPVYDLTSSVMILNSGNWKSNDASITVLDQITGTISTTDLFSSVNGKKLGDVANDILVYGSKMYIAVTNSEVIFVCNLDGKIIKEIKEGSPRCFCASDGKVYATLYEGYAAAIDTASFAVKKIETGPNPEGIACSYGKIYVADSYGYDPRGQYGTTVTVIDQISFSVIKQLTVNNNPHKFEVTPDGTLYLVTWGNYADIPAALQKINPVNDAVTTVPGVVPTDMTLGETGYAYILSSSYDAEWNQTFSYYTYNTIDDTVIGELVSTLEVPYGSFIKYDALSQQIFIGASNYTENGDLYVLDTKGTVLAQYDTGGMNPIALAFVRRGTVRYNI